VDTKGTLVHIDRANEIAMAKKAALTAHPSSTFGLMTMPASRTPATGTSFGAGRAQDVSLFAFVREIVDIFAVFPLRHTSIVVSATIVRADAMGVADEERADFLLDAEVNHLTSGFVPQISHALLCPATYLVPGTLQFLPAPRVVLAAILLFGELAKLPTALALEGADASPGHDECLARVGGNSGQVYFPQVDRCLNGSWGRLRLLKLDADMQLEATVPDKRTSPGTLRKRERQDQGWAAFAHRQDDCSFSLCTAWAGHLTG
jgi:hypothetical protein